MQLCCAGFLSNISWSVIWEGYGLPLSPCQRNFCRCLVVRYQLGSMEVLPICALHLVDSLVCLVFVVQYYVGCMSRVVCSSFFPHAFESRVLLGGDDTFTYLIACCLCVWCQVMSSMRSVFCVNYAGVKSIICNVNNVGSLTSSDC